MTLVPADLAVGVLIHSLHQHLFGQQIYVELLQLPNGMSGAGDMGVTVTVPSLQGVCFQVEKKETINEEKITDGDGGHERSKRVTLKMPSAIICLKVLGTTADPGHEGKKGEDSVVYFAN